MNEPRLMQLLEGLQHQIEGAEREMANRDKGGQHVPFKGDFANVPPSGLHRLKWWARELIEAATEPQKEQGK